MSVNEVQHNDRTEAPVEASASARPMLAQNVRVESVAFDRKEVS
jgi:hypothetical protein